MELSSSRLWRAHACIAWTGIFSTLLQGELVARKGKFLQQDEEDYKEESYVWRKPLTTTPVKEETLASKASARLIARGGTYEPMELFALLDINRDGEICREELRAGYLEMVVGELRMSAKQYAAGGGEQDAGGNSIRRDEEPRAAAFFLALFGGFSSFPFSTNSLTTPCNAGGKRSSSVGGKLTSSRSR